MNSSVLTLAMGKWQGRLGSFALIKQLVEEEKTSEFKPAILCLKIDLVSHPARDRGDGQIHPK